MEKKRRIAMSATFLRVGMGGQTWGPLVSAVLFLALVRSVAEGGGERLGARIGFQAHSYNNMRSWHQLFLKGATHIKIDPNFQSASFCKSQVRDAARDEKGCFVLNHDTPSIFSRRFDYNTTSDLLSLMENKASPLRKFLTRRKRVYSYALKIYPTM